MARLMPAVEHWKARGVPQQQTTAASSPLHSMSEQLWIFIRAVEDALPAEVLPACRWLVLSPAMIAEHGLPMHDRPDVGWPFGEVANARQSRENLACDRTHCNVDFRELFAADINHRKRAFTEPRTAVETRARMPASSSEEGDLDAVDNAQRPIYSEQKIYSERKVYSEQKDPDAVCRLGRPVCSEEETPHAAVAPASAPPPLSISAIMPKTSSTSGSASVSASASSHSLASSSATSLPRAPTADGWIWPAPEASPIGDADVSDDKLWRWHFISNTNKVGDTWIDLSASVSNLLTLTLTLTQTRSVTPGSTSVSNRHDSLKACFRTGQAAWAASRH